MATHRTELRLPDRTLVDYIRKKAEEQERSYNQQLVWYIRRGIAAEERDSPRIWTSDD